MALKKGVDPDSLFDFFILLFVAGVLGGRLLHMALNPASYQDLQAVLDLRDGGLSIHGVLLGGLIAVIVYCHVKKVRLGQLLDIVVPGVALGQSIGRWGCLFNGCCYGTLTGGAWGVLTRYAPGLRHPYPIYESMLDFLLFILLLKMSERVKFDGVCLVYFWICVYSFQVFRKIRFRVSWLCLMVFCPVTCSIWVVSYLSGDLASTTIPCNYPQQICRILDNINPIPINRNTV